MNKAYRVRLYPTQEQEVLINKTFGCVRLVWNTLLDKNIKGFENEGKSWKQDYNTTKLKDSFEFLNEVSAASLQQKARDLKETYSQWFRSVTGKRKIKIGYPKFKSKKFLITTMIQPFRTTLKWFCSGGLNHGQKQGSISKKHEHSYLYSALWR